jgi:hypothetical protein
MPTEMASGGWWLRYEEVVRNPYEVREGSTGAHEVLSMVVRLCGEKPATGTGTGGHR